MLYTFVCVYIYRHTLAPRREKLREKKLRKAQREKQQQKTNKQINKQSSIKDKKQLQNSEPHF